MLWGINSRSFHQAILNLVEPSAPVLVGEVVVRKPLLLCLLDLPEQGGLVRQVMPDQHPSAGLIAHLPVEKLMKIGPVTCNLNNADRVLNCCLTGINIFGIVHRYDEYSPHR